VSQLSLAVPIRAVLKRVSRRYPDIALKLSASLTATCDPVRRRTSSFRFADRVMGRIFPSMCYDQTYRNINPKILYELSELDAHDALTDHYKHFERGSRSSTAWRD